MKLFCSLQGGPLSKLKDQFEPSAIINKMLTDNDAAIQPPASLLPHAIPSCDKLATAHAAPRRDHAHSDSDYFKSNARQRRATLDAAPHFSARCTARCRKLLRHHRAEKQAA
jgi:hypothetical protein